MSDEPKDRYSIEYDSYSNKSCGKLIMDNHTNTQLCDFHTEPDADKVKRIIACLNACDGLQDPEKEIPELLHHSLSLGMILRRSITKPRTDEEKQGHANV